MRRALAILLATGALLAPVVGASAQETAESDGLGIRLLEVPADRAGDPRAQSYIIDHVEAGDVVERRVQVVNDQAQPVLVRVYPAGAEVRDGTFTPSPSEAEDDLARWTEVDHPTLEMEPRSSADVAITIRVPSDAPDGERYGAIWAELPAAESGSGVTLVNRVGIRIYLSVGEGGEPASDFEIDTLTSAREADGTPVVRAEVHNTGGRALDMRGELELTDGPAGLSAGPFPAQLGITLGIGQTGNVLVQLGRELPDGPWTATLTLRSGELERTVRATLTFPAGAGQVGEAVDTERVTDSLPGLLLAGLALLLALLVASGILWYVRTRRRAAEAGTETGPG